MNTKTDDKKIKRLAVFALVSVLVFVFSVIIAFAYFFVDFSGEREIIIIPKYTGNHYSQIPGSDKIKLERELVFSDEVPEGVIISQTPYARARRKLAEGEKYTVKLTVSLGNETQTIPELVDYKYNEASAALRSIGARIRIVSVYDDEAERDFVLRTSPAAGEKIKRGDTVTLFVSRNHIHGSVRVKDFVGIPKEVACAELLAQGLMLGEITEEYSDRNDYGTVISQSIKPDSYVLYGTRIDIVVSIGQKTEDLHPFRKDIIRENEEVKEFD